MFAMETYMLQYTISFGSAGKLCSEIMNIPSSAFFLKCSKCDFFFFNISDRFDEDCSSQLVCVEDGNPHVQNISFLQIPLSLQIPDFSMKEEPQKIFWRKQICVLLAEVFIILIFFYIR